MPPELYETRVVLTVRFAASCRPEALGRANRICESLERILVIVRAAGYDVEAERGVPRLVDREKRTRLEPMPLDADPAE